MAPTQTNSQNRKTTPLLLSQKNKYITSRAAETSLTHYNSCIACKLQHPLYGCTVFKEMSHQKRLDLVIGSRRCYRCLDTHLAKNCTSKGTCKVCGGVKHHILLHPPKPTKEYIYSNFNPSVQ